MIILLRLNRGYALFFFFSFEGEKLVCSIESSYAMNLVRKTSWSRRKVINGKQENIVSVISLWKSKSNRLVVLAIWGSVHITLLVTIAGNWGIWRYNLANSPLCRTSPQKHHANKRIIYQGHLHGGCHIQVSYQKLIQALGEISERKEEKS